MRTRIDGTCDPPGSLVVRCPDAAGQSERSIIRLRASNQERHEGFVRHIRLEVRNEGDTAGVPLLAFSGAE